MSGEPVPPRPDGFGAPPVPPAPVPAEPARAPASWRWWEAIGVYVLGILLGGIATLPLFRVIRSEGLANLVASAATAVVIVGILVAWLMRFHPGSREAIGFPRRAWPEVRAGVGFGLLLYPMVVFGVGLVLTLLLQALSGGSVRAPRQIPAELSAAGLAAAVVYAIAIAPIHEELFFRGVLYRSIRDRHGFWLASLGSSFAFAAVHYLPGPWPNSLLLMGVMFFTGFALAYVYDRRGNFLAVVVAHATFNAIGLALILSLR